MLGLSTQTGHSADFECEVDFGTLLDRQIEVGTSDGAEALRLARLEAIVA